MGGGYIATRLPPPQAISPALYQEPRQVNLTRQPFTVTYNGQTSTIAPIADYEIRGLIVSPNRRW